MQSAIYFIFVCFISIKGFDILDQGIDLQDIVNGLPGLDTDARKLILKNSMKKIEEHNELFKEGKVSFLESVTKLAALDPKEYKEKILSYIPSYVVKGLEGGLFDKMKEMKTVDVMNASLSDSMDWRTENKVTSVKDQGICGSCWAFSSLGAVESHYAIKNDELLDLSEQCLVDCVKKNNGCKGGAFVYSFDYIEKTGVSREENYPYKGMDGSCKEESSLVKIISFENLKPDENNMKKAVASKGPIAVSINADMLQYYSGGIFNEPSCPKNSNNHGVVIVGFNKENGVDYWIIKNSFGDKWGENGYMRMIYGQNMCGISNEAQCPNF